MATRAELLATFEAALDGFLLPATGRNAQWQVMPDNKSAIVQAETSVDAAHTLEAHICYFWRDDTNVIANRQFYVKDRGEVGEEAVWIRSDNPIVPAPDPTFAQDVSAWLDSQIGLEFGAGSTLVYYTVLSTLESIRRGTVQVLLLNAGVLTSLMMAVWKNVADEWQFKAITS